MGRIFAGQEDRPTVHDIRRTVGTMLGKLGFNRLVQDKVLNHKDRGVGGIYDRHSYDREKRAALEAWARELQRIVMGATADNVVTLAR
jgi:integrase